jgi:hypothetical protein
MSARAMPTGGSDRPPKRSLSIVPRKSATLVPSGIEKRSRLSTPKTEPKNAIRVSIPRPSSRRLVYAGGFSL